MPFKISTFNLGNPIPKNVRLRVYKQALKLYTDYVVGKHSKLDDYSMALCLLLPCILYSFNSYLDIQPNGNIFSWRDTRKSFPELHEFLVNIRYDERFTIPNYVYLTNEDRIEFLKEAIQKLQSKQL